MKRSLRPNAAFTLLEIMLVVLIISLLVAMGVKMLGGKIEEAKVTTAQGSIEQLKVALVMYETASRTLPSTAEGLKALLVKPASNPRNWQVRIEPSQLNDPWNHEFNYAQPGVHNPRSYDLFSSGPDGQPNTPDDIGNWEEKKN